MDRPTRKCASKPNTVENTAGENFSKGASDSSDSLPFNKVVKKKTNKKPLTETNNNTEKVNLNCSKDVGSALVENANYFDMAAVNEFLSISHLNQTDSIIIPEMTHEDITKILSKPTLKGFFPFNIDMNNTIETFVQLNRAIFDLNAVQLDQLIDLYHLAIKMQTYKNLETLCMPYRIELLNAVSELSVGLQSEYIDAIGTMLCDRFLLGTGKERMERVNCLHKSLVILIQNSEINRKIAMAILLAILVKMSGVPKSVQATDIISQAFEMMKLVNWMEMFTEDRFEDGFVLVRSFSIIINTQQNKIMHTNWKTGIGSEIHKFFMTVLRSFRYSSKYPPIVMMMERFIAFCLVNGATPRSSFSDVMQHSVIN